MLRIRLLKVVCQAVFVIDDGEHLTEQVAQPVSVPAEDWPSYPTGAFLDAFEELRRRFETEGPKPN